MNHNERWLVDKKVGRVDYEASQNSDCNQFWIADIREEFKLSAQLRQSIQEDERVENAVDEEAHVGNWLVNVAGEKESAVRVGERQESSRVEHEIKCSEQTNYGTSETVKVE